MVLVSIHVTGSEEFCTTELHLAARAEWAGRRRLRQVRAKMSGRQQRPDLEEAVRGCGGSGGQISYTMRGDALTSVW